MLYWHIICPFILTIVKGIPFSHMDLRVAWPELYEIWENISQYISDILLCMKV